jgi:hypothetical protein
MKAVRISETSVDNYFTRQYIPQDYSEHHARRRENFKSHILYLWFKIPTPYMSTYNINVNVNHSCTEYPGH